MLKVDIDSNSGFCAGVIRAIGKAEDFLGRERNGNGRRLYSLGAIVHNDAELTRLTRMGLVTIDKEDMEEMVNATGETLLIRAHGEPPQTYRLAESLGFEWSCSFRKRFSMPTRRSRNKARDRSSSSENPDLPRYSDCWDRRRERPSSSKM